MEKFMNSDLNIEKIVLACLVEKGAGTNVHRNRASHGLALFFGGKRILNFDNKRLTVEGNRLVFFPKGSNYTITNIEVSDCYAINFELGGEEFFEPFDIKIENVQSYLSAFKVAKNLWDSRDISSRLKIKSLLYDIIYKMHKEYEKSVREENNSVAPAIEYINSNYLSKNISVTLLANLCNFSEVYLRRKFAEEFGISPNKYIKQLRLRHAEELLLSGFYKINEICYLSGFNDESYFNREFKKYFGKPPKEYEKSHSLKI